MSVKQYRLRQPVRVSFRAIQWTMDNWQDLAAFAGGNVRMDGSGVVQVCTESGWVALYNKDFVALDDSRFLVYGAEAFEERFEPVEYARGGVVAARPVWREGVS